MTHEYVHGYEDAETTRLSIQANTLAEILHSDTFYPSGCSVLEGGCGTGSQTMLLARTCPDAHFTSIDISQRSVDLARTATAAFSNVEIQIADLYSLPYVDNSFDHTFVSFVLEHLSHPIDALFELKRVTKTGGTITVIEGDHGSVFFHPDSSAAKLAIQCQIQLQRNMGGNPCIGRCLRSLLHEAGFKTCRISPRLVHVDADKIDLAEGFTRRTFIAMVEGIRMKAFKSGMISLEIFDRGIHDLERTTQEDGVFCYTFFKATAYKE